MKKIISLVLFFFLLTGACMPSAYAVSYKQGMDALRSQFVKGDGMYLDYVYYSPVKTGDTQKYPLVVWLHGNSSGDYPGHQLDNCDIAMWSSEEYQKRFEDTKGAFLFLPRSPTNALTIAWEGDQLRLKGAIDQFIIENKRYIDTDRIYIGGYSMGGKMAYIMPMRYTDFFAAAFLLSPVYSPDESELDSLSKTPVWLAYCKNDLYPSLNRDRVIPNWRYLTGISECPEKCRLSTFDGIYRPDGSYCGKDEIHNTWNAACYDFLMNDGTQYKDMTVIDGAGNLVQLGDGNGLISWLSQQNLKNEETPVKGIFSGFVEIIKKMFSTMLKWFSIFGRD